MPREKQRRLTPIEERIRRKHTRLAIPDFEKNGKGQVWIEVGHQSFCLSGWHTRTQGNWYRRQLAIALARVALQPI